MGFALINLKHNDVAVIQLAKDVVDGCLSRSIGCWGEAEVFVQHLGGWVS